ncbi:hypothetical protein ACFWYW_47145 [Nonomuraea sp. NPDC059023]|uniref:hypothetical protein n=1 Tax=unclassified Nonomuraea TaxID=2593643 RepID=UPI00368A45D3
MREELSILVADYRRKKPITAQRPTWVTGPPGKSGIDRAFAIMQATTLTIS